MRPTLCARCKKNPAVIFVTKIEHGDTTNEGFCLKCAKDLNIKPVQDIIKKMGLTDEDLDNLTDEMIEAMAAARPWPSPTPTRRTRARPPPSRSSTGYSAARTAPAAATRPRPRVSPTAGTPIPPSGRTGTAAKRKNIWIPTASA